MKQVAWSVMICMTGVLLVVSGCGIPKEEFQAEQQRVAALATQVKMKNNELEEKEAAYQKCLQEKDSAIGKLKALGEETSTLSAELTEKQKQIAELEIIKRSAEKRQKALDDLLGKFKALIASGKLSINVIDGRMVIQLPSGVLFKAGRAKLSKKGKEAVAEVAEVLKTIDNRKFQVAGHTDNQRKKGRKNPNWSLSYKRALAVFQLLLRKDVQEENLSIAAYAEYSPVAPNDTPENREKNRRIEIVLLPNSDELPMASLKKLKN